MVNDVVTDAAGGDAVVTPVEKKVAEEVKEAVPEKNGGGEVGEETKEVEPEAAKKDENGAGDHKGRSPF